MNCGHDTFTDAVRKGCPEKGTMGGDGPVGRGGGGGGGQGSLGDGEAEGRGSENMGGGGWGCFALRSAATQPVPV